MADRKFASVELVMLEYNINLMIYNGDYEQAAKLIKESSGLYEFELSISDKQPDILRKLIPNFDENYHPNIPKSK